MADNEKKEPQFTITLTQLQTLANYITKRPWDEVNGLIQLIQSLPKQEEAAVTGPTLVPAAAPTAPAAPTQAAQ